MPRLVIVIAAVLLIVHGLLHTIYFSLGSCELEHATDRQIIATTDLPACAESSDCSAILPSVTARYNL